MAFWKLFAGYFFLAYLPASFFPNIFTVLFALIFAGAIIFIDGQKTTSISKPKLALLSCIFVILIFAVVVVLFQLGVIQIWTPKWKVYLIPLVLLLCAHFIFQKLYPDQNSEELSAKPLASLERSLPMVESLAKRYANVPVTASVAIAAVLGWGGYCYFVKAHETASAGTAKKKTVAFGFSRSQNGFVPYCVYQRQLVAEKFLRSKVAQVNRKYIKKETGVVALHLFGKLLNQPFGDKNYERYIKKYGTNPYDKLSGGALSKGPKALARIVSSQKRAEIARLEARKQKFMKQSNRVCSCQFNAAFSETRLDWTIYAMTFGAIKPATIETNVFRNRARRKARVCNS